MVTTPPSGKPRCPWMWPTKGFLHDVKRIPSMPLRWGGSRGNHGSLRDWTGWYRAVQGTAPVSRRVRHGDYVQHTVECRGAPRRQGSSGHAGHRRHRPVRRTCT
ncbi:hypothetical protein DMY01_06860 [Cutibacterium avidum]|uniref:Uncharacterized protein n=1 Tax=Cutibacterium avidum TaxID=33010 RepID=A0A3E2DKV4_9ACTN|nr:hypothetical protein CHT91_04100 [Cutibacterium avidum]TMT51241.1 hypothetical protein DMY01_06860 [Cutibacterium avidum]